MEYKNYYARHLNGVTRLSREELLNQISKVGINDINQITCNDSLFTDFVAPFLSKEQVTMIVENIF